MRRQRAFAATAIFTLALGIGATTALFSVVNAVVLRPLPLVESDRLVAILRHEVPLVRGRDFTDADRADAPCVAIVNESLVRESFQGRDPIGQTIRTGLDTLDQMTIVGIVRDVRTWGPTRPAKNQEEQGTRNKGKKRRG